MLKVLCKKQLYEIFSGFFFNRKTGKMRSKGSTAFYMLMYIVLMVGVIAGMFGWVANAICAELVEAGLDWFYFVLMILIAMSLGIFGSVFNTYATLYNAKDNELILSMPIPPKYIIISRLISVYLLGLLYSAVVYIPAVIIYFKEGAGSPAAFIGCIAVMAAISGVILAVSCLLGWLVAKLTNRIKGKSFVTVFLSLIFFGAYYFVCFKATELLQSLLINAEAIAGGVKGAAYPLYMVGKAAVGDFMAMAVIILITAALVALTVSALNRSFIKLATSTGKERRVKYKETRAKKKGVLTALISKEIRRFTASANYMLNCGLGVALIPVAGIILLIKADYIIDIMTLIFEDSDVTAILFISAICMMCSLIDIAAPSVALEGKSVWIVQSLPVTPWQVLKGKLCTQLALSGIPVAFTTLCAVYVLLSRNIITLFTGGLMCLASLLFVLMYGLLCVCVSLQKPNLNWTNETAPLKQSMGVFVAIISSAIYGFAIGMLYITLDGQVGANAFLVLISVVTALIGAGFYYWIKNKGTKVFQEL